MTPVIENHEVSAMRTGSVAAVFFLLAAFGPCRALAQAPTAEKPDIVVGDAWTLERTDRGSGTKSDVSVKTIAVGPGDLTVAFVEAATATEQKWTRELNYVSGEGKRTWNPSSQSFSFPLSVGKQWKIDAKGTNAGGRDVTLNGNCKVAAFEKVSVKAGTFDTFRVECDSEFYVYGPSIAGKSRYVAWYAPAAKFHVRSELLAGDRLSTFSNWTQELVSTTVK